MLLQVNINDRLFNKLQSRWPAIEQDPSYNLPAYDERYTTYVRAYVCTYVINETFQNIKATQLKSTIEDFNRGNFRFSILVNDTLRHFHRHDNPIRFVKKLYLKLFAINFSRSSLVSWIFNYYHRVSSITILKRIHLRVRRRMRAC